MAHSKYPCPCCGYRVFDDPPGSFQHCPICGWQDDNFQLRYAGESLGSNPVSLIEAQKNYAAFGATTKRLKSKVRKPTPDEAHDEDWRPIDLAVDTVEKVSIEAMATTKTPENGTFLYYWRTSFWKRN